MRVGEDGATAIEYAILASLIALAIVVTAGAIGLSLNDLFFSRILPAFD
jgi:Flp pilus assembly pilin Flp